MRNKFEQPAWGSSQRRFRRVKLFSTVDAFEKEATRKVPVHDGAQELCIQQQTEEKDITAKRLALKRAKDRDGQRQTEAQTSFPTMEDVQGQVPTPLTPTRGVTTSRYSLPSPHLSEKETEKMPALNGTDHRDVPLQAQAPDTVGEWSMKGYSPTLPVPEGIWKPGTFGFDSSDDETTDYEPQFKKRETLSMMVLTGISKEQGQPKPVMQSEISGAASDASFVGGGSVISFALKYCVIFLIQYGFGPALYGLYTLSSSLINLIASVLSLGLDDAMIRYTAIYRSRQRATSLQGLAIFCTALAGIAGIVGALLLLFFTPYLASLWISLNHHNIRTQNIIAQAIPLFQIMALMIPLLTMQTVWFGGLRGFKAFKWRTITMSILQPLVQIVLLLFLLRFFHINVGIQGVALIMVISTIFSTILNLYLLFRQIARVATPDPEQYESREWFSFASVNFLTTIIDTVLDSVDTILLAAFGVAVVQLGEYGAAFRMSIFIIMPLLTLNNIFAPTIAELHSKGEMQKLEAMFKVVAKWSITFSLPIFLITALFSTFLLEISGAGFIAAWPLVIAFGIASMINTGTGSVGYMLLMTGHQKLSFLNSIVAVVVNIVLGIILTPRYGAMGVAISTGVAYAVINLMRLVQVRLLLKMHPYRWDAFKPLGAGLISAILTGGMIYLLYLSHLKLSIQLGHAILAAQLLLIPVFLAMYIGLIVLFKVSPEDEIVMNSIRKKLARGKM